MTEYILLIAIIATGIMIVMQGLTRIGISQKLMRPLTQEFAATYRYGHPKARGFEEGSPQYHPRITRGNNNFRIFINPRTE